MHQITQKLVKSEVLETIGERKRNRPLHVPKDKIPQLQNLILKAVKNTPAPLNGHANQARAPRRVIYLEQRVEELEKRIDEQAAKFGRLEQFEQEINQLKTEVHCLVELWS